MASTSFAETRGTADTPSQSASEPRKSFFFRPFSPLANVYHRFAQWRTDLGLPNPGTVENLQKEVKGTMFAFPPSMTAYPRLNSYASDQLCVRWRPSGPYENIVDEPCVSSDPFLRSGFTSGAPIVQFCCRVCNPRGSSIFYSSQ
jgi:hypothetical protein